MSVNSWANGVSGDWNTGGNWSSGAAPLATDSVSIAAAGAYTVSLYRQGYAASVTMNAPGALFYDAGTLTLGGVFALQAGTLALAYGSLQGGTLALTGGTLLAGGGTLDAMTVQGTLDLSHANASLVVRNGLTLTGSGGIGAGSLSLTGSYAAMDFLGTQSFDRATVSLGAGNALGAATLAATHSYGASSGTTLTLGANLWIREASGQGAITAGNALPGDGLSDVVVNLGTITANAPGGTLTLSGSGTFSNQGTIAVSNGDTLTIASGGFINTGTISVTNATLALGGSFSASRLGGLGNLTLTQSSVAITGTMDNSGNTLTIGGASALGRLSLAGTIAGGTLVDNGGGLGFGAGTGMLNGVAYRGALDLSSAGGALTLTGNASLSALDGSAGTATVTGAGASLLLQGTETLDRATILLGSAGSAASLGTFDPWLASAATTATLGPNLIVTQVAANAAVAANATTPFVGFGLSDTLINQGTINGGVAGGTLTLGGYGSFINQGQIAVSNGDTLVVTPGSFSNFGTISISSGGVVVLGGPGSGYGIVPTWSNSGLITVAGGSLILAGGVRTSQLGSITVSQGSVTLAGTLSNAGATLALGADGVLPALSLTGTIQGGTVSDAGGKLSIGGYGTALLDGVSYRGTLMLGANAFLRIRNGLTLNGTASVTGASSILAFQGSQIFDHASMLLGAAGIAASIDVSHDYGGSGGSTLTLGANSSITQAGALACLGRPLDLAGDGILNLGTITAGVAGGTFTLGGAGFANRGRISVSNGDTLLVNAAAFSNTGTIAVANASLSLAGSVTLAGLGRLVLSNAAISIGGTLDATGGTLTIGAGSAWGRVALGGTIRGGIVIDGGQGLAVTGNALLDGVSYRGTLDVSRPFAQLAIADGITLTDATGTLPGTILLTGAGTRLVATTSETIDNATILLGSASETYNGQQIHAAELSAGPGATLTIGASAQVRSAGLVGWIGDASLGRWTDSVVNNGIIIAATSSGMITLGSTFFTNAGGIAIGLGGNVSISDVSFTNTGTLSLTLGSYVLVSLYAYYAAPNSGPALITNSGLIRMVGGALVEQTGNGLFPFVPIANLPGGLIQGVGTIVAPIVNNGTIEAKYGQLTVTGSLTGVGALIIDPGCILDVGNVVSATQTVSFTGVGETLKIDQPSLFAAQVAGYSTGDTISLGATQLTALAISSGTLVANTATGTFRLSTTTPLGGALSAGQDGHGGATISITPQSIGGPTATIAVGQSAMLFWAAPAGDEFQGASANLNGARIGNWGTSDSLDFTDLNSVQSSLSYTQSGGLGVVALSDGVHSATVSLVGVYNSSWFHLGSDGSGGTLVIYSHP